MERRFGSYEDLARNGQYPESTENQGMALQHVAALPPLSSFPKEQRQWNATVEQNILELRRTLTSVAKNVTIIGDNMATKADIQEIKELIRLGQQQPAATSGTYQKPAPVKQNPPQAQQGQANTGHVVQGR